MSDNFWTIPQLWERDADPVFIIGGGPSLKGFDASRLYGRKVIAVNSAFRLGMNEFPVMFYGDPLWPSLFAKDLCDFAGIKVTVREEHRDRPGIRVVRRDQTAWGLSLDASKLHWNLSSGSCAINLAVLLGAGKIILLGFDMQQVNGVNNFHNDYLHHESGPAPVGNYEIMLSKFPAIARDLALLNIECVNASPSSKLDCFPKCTIEEALQC